MLARPVYYLSTYIHQMRTKRLGLQWKGEIPSHTSGGNLSNGTTPPDHYSIFRGPRSLYYNTTPAFTCFCPSRFSSSTSFVQRGCNNGCLSLGRH